MRRAAKISSYRVCRKNAWVKRHTRPARRAALLDHRPVLGLFQRFDDLVFREPRDPLQHVQPEVAADHGRHAEHLVGALAEPAQALAHHIPQPLGDASIGTLIGERVPPALTHHEALFHEVTQHLLDE